MPLNAFANSAFLRIFHLLLSSADFFSKSFFCLFFKKKLFHEYYHSSNILNPDQVRRNVCNLFAFCSAFPETSGEMSRGG